MEGPRGEAAPICGSWTGFKHHVERRLGGPAHLRETALPDNIPEPLLAGLCAECGADLLAEGSGHAHTRRKCVVDAANGIHVLGKRVARLWFYQHQRAVALQRVSGM